MRFLTIIVFRLQKTTISILGKEAKYGKTLFFVKQCFRVIIVMNKIYDQTYAISDVDTNAFSIK